jgi:uncharacterized protein YutE (UPF0331/DUF86 family)
MADWGKLRYVDSGDTEKLKLLELVRSQNGEKVVRITSLMFVAMMSAIEAVAKMADRNKPSVVGIVLQGKQRLYLRKIIEASADRGLITADQQKLWDGLFRLRNCLVHNDGRADEDFQIKIS